MAEYKRLPRVTVVDQVIDEFKDALHTGRLQVGDSLPPEKDLAAQMGVGRNSVREALRVLEAYGVIETKPKDGAIIVDRLSESMLNLLSFHFSLDTDTFIHLQEFRKLIEIGCASDICSKITEEGIRQLNDNIAEMSLGGDSKQLGLLDARFHFIYLSMVDNPIIIQVYLVMSKMIRNFLSVYKHDEALRVTLEGHRNIVSALQERNASLCRKMVAQHLEDGIRIFKTKSKGADKVNDDS